MTLIDKAFDNSEDMTKAKLWDGQNKTDMEISRRNRVDKMTPVELCLYSAILELKKQEEDPIINKAISLIEEAKNIVGDFLEQSESNALSDKTTNNPL